MDLEALQHLISFDGKGNRFKSCNGGQCRRIEKAWNLGFILVKFYFCIFVFGIWGHAHPPGFTFPFVKCKFGQDETETP